ncbi:phosphonate metabolism protein/1,5-bisphosphokinase (PRPP-forming) PhnN [Mesorhizobium sp.]|uniref:phosphonate metabolism protein/1,5-bisphosphokinase (PRPP-forming) PhnN n=1 Tax=Mesorhizobium sp. TaxID=1871066 RepID=UPI00121413E1|nr:phosphonate metabolism protein/1,5-bisphosphokinase (PRPP-forming) PhnN [Mesorhizobium sp.]TIO08964.1 MAG: phosphonate metabolism protein/1,5-bisphosphokinase (PRPP-forming) PhnN [Mesorhizobium sp.]TIO30654.1 MAG: phosphonate metabolism protein/1,5-bisphosphokinase (PRPP-forming) PhnN [Mesorhizobium sp.]TIP12462.1 MAG: phosphonate metabolism protein/1,5-bisphosphokinase (PRPP-forming) PhnN [Mesorhizobium sp.]
MTVSASIERELSAAAFPIRDGVFVAVVGPSGAGKDTVIGYARTLFADESRLDFVRRVITRPSDTSEDHDTLADAAFVEAEADGAFAIAWEAHGLRYGIPAEVDWSVANGRVAIANVSRAIIPVLRERYANLAVVEITASPEILAERLAMRGRESRGEVLARLARSANVALSGPGVTSIDNSGPREAAGERFADVLRKAMAFSDMSGLI